MHLCMHLELLMVWKFDLCLGRQLPHQMQHNVRMELQIGRAPFLTRVHSYSRDLQLQQYF